MNSEVKTIVQPEIEEAIPGDEPSVKYTKAEKKGGKRIGYNYIILKSLKESKKNDVVKCWYIKSLTDFGFCVIKEGSYGDTKDKYGRDIKDRLIWQKELHETLQHKVRLPRYIGSFEENGNYYLVIERIKGKSLSRIFKEVGRPLRDDLMSGSETGIKFLRYLMQVVDILNILHEHQIVHRDVTLNNFMIRPGNKAVIIDMELSYSLKKEFPSPPFQLGTFGYMSPEQEAISIPTTKEDIFAIGAIMLQLWSGISPYKLTPVNLPKAMFFIPDQGFAALVASCMDADPLKRPSTDHIRDFLLQYQRDVRRKIKRPVSGVKDVSRQKILDTIQSGICALGSSILADQEKGWFADNISGSNLESKIDKKWYASFSRGSSGIIYFLALAQRMGFDMSSVKMPLEQGLQLITEKYIQRKNRHTPGLHFGSDGVAVALAMAIENDLIQDTMGYTDSIERLLTDTSNSFDIISGMAGQGMANLICAPYTTAAGERMQRYAEKLIDAQTSAGAWMNIKGHNIPGFAYGDAGVISYLLEYGHRYGHQPSLDTAERGLRHLLTYFKEGIWKSHAGKKFQPFLLGGSAGIAMAFIKGYEYIGRDFYRDIVYATVKYPQLLPNTWSNSFGVSGLGEVYLEAAKVFNDAGWMKYANDIARLLYVTRKQQGERSFWLVDHERIPVGGFMIGNAGVMHVLLRQAFPDKIAFPLFPRSL